MSVWFWVLLGFLVYYVYRVSQFRKSIAVMNQYLESAIKAGITSSSADEYIEDFVLWTNNGMTTPANTKFVASLYARYNLPPDEYGYITDELKNKMKNEYRVIQYDLRVQKTSAARAQKNLG